MAKETADALRKEAEALGGAQRSTDSGLKKEGENRISSNRSEQDIENKDVPAEAPEAEELDEEAEEDEEKLEDEPEDKVDNPDDSKGDEPADENESEGDEPEDKEPDDKDGQGKDKKSTEDERRGNLDNAARRVNAKKQTEVNELREKVRLFEEAESKRAEEALKGEIVALAQELKSDPAGLEKVINLAVKIAERKIGQRIPSKEALEAIGKPQVSKFDTDFAAAPVQDYLSDTYPKATSKQIIEAKTLLKKLAKDSAYPLDYFFVKNKKDFDAILDVRRRRGLETARRHGVDAAVENRDTNSASGVDDLDKKYREASSDSGLRRERTSEKTF